MRKIVDFVVGMSIEAGSLKGTSKNGAADTTWLTGLDF
jgi:hypothetical protein